tara:strand:+ start:1305 stop:1886 length:582 start_codon:yes stop_codon:yes gene_type:complete
MAKPIWQNSYLMLGAMLLVLVLGGNAASEQSSQMSLIQFVRKMIGIDRPIAVGGSRGSESLSICLITPRIEISSQGELVAAASVTMPTLLVAEPLNEVRIYRQGLEVWHRVASSTAAIEGPINWPIEPVKPEEELMLYLRPRGASGGDFVKITLVGDNKASMNANQRVLAEIGEDPLEWVKELEASGDNDFCK